MNKIKKTNNKIKKQNDDMFLKENGEIISTYYQEKNKLPIRWLEAWDYITVVKSKDGNEIKLKAPYERVNKDFLAWKKLNLPTNSIDNKMIAWVQKIKVDSIEAFILAQDPAVQEHIERKLKIRRKENKRINLEIVKNIKENFKN